jgi:M6 family metalloprotease-like protein
MHFQTSYALLSKTYKFFKNAGAIFRFKIDRILSIRFYCLFFFILTLLIPFNLPSQVLNHSLSIEQDFKPKNFINTTETINILAVMVQFQTDKDTLTTGNGNFDLSTKYRDSIRYRGSKILIDTIVDAPPHNSEYFINHLTFLKNYYEKVSDGKIKINFTIPAKIYTLPDQMKDYSPPLKGSDYTKLANLVNDSWRLVDSLSPEIDFSQYQCFFIFHAGAGRDIDLASIYGADPTPYDLPSIYFNLKSLQKYLPNLSNGIPVDKGKFLIKNSAIIPEMEYRIISGIGGSTLYQLSINGVIASSIGSFLGLPDLFNTKTGATAIGRFGLMDGQSIFSYSGLFPPEPSAWEKVYLGWVKPIEISSGSMEVTIYAHRTDGESNNNYQIYKIPINSKEYFLIECRYRDPGKNGQKLIMRSNGIDLEYTLKRDTAVFDQNGDVWLIDGVLTDVADFDWSLPGGLDYKKNELYGGILIWHIDENVINSKIESNSINDDPLHRGVNLMEADGSQDIGQDYSSAGLTHPGYGSENGTALDFWYDDLSYYNKDSLLRPVYKNIFSPTSNPDSRSYDGSNSHITIYDFSKQGPVMTFKVKIGDESVELLPGFPKMINGFSDKKSDLLSADINGDGNEEIFVMANGSLWGFNQDGLPLLNDTTGKILDKVYSVSFSDIRKDGRSQIVCDRLKDDPQLPGNHKIESYEIVNNPAGNSLEKKLDLIVPIFEKDTLFPIVYLEDNLTHYLILLKSRGIFIDCKNEQGKFTIGNPDTIFKPVQSLSGFVTIDKTNNQPFEWIALGINKEKNNSGLTGDVSQYSEFKNLMGGDFNGDGKPESAVLVYEKDQSKVDLVIFDKASNSLIIHKLFSNACTNCWKNISLSSAGDINGDGKQDVVFTAFDDLYAYNYNGVSLPNFPVKFKNSSPSISPIIGDIDGDKINDIVIVSNDGKIYAYNNKGKLINGFPLSIGLSPASTPLIFKSNNKVGISVLSSDGYLYAWRLQGEYDPNHVPWISNYANSRRTSFANETLARQTIGSELLPKSKAYNWPNPVYGGTTNIRYYLEQNANVTIKIFDFSGEKVTELTGPGIGGIDNEVEWNVKDVQSGVYFARVEANSSTSNSIAIIRIAIVK